MTAQPETPTFAIDAQKLSMLQDFVSNLPIPWKQTNPIMQMLISLPEVTVQPPKDEREIKST